MASAPTAHVPPQNIEAEESVLGAMLVSEPTLTRVIDEVKLNAADFYLEKHGAIFTCVHDLYAASKPVDELSVTEALVQRNQIEEAGGKHYVSELAAKVPAAGNAKHYAEIVQQNSLLRRLLGAGQQIQGWVHERDGEPRELSERAEKLLFDVAHKEQASDFKLLSEILHGEVDRLEKLSTGEAELTGTPSGFRDIDAITGGFQPGNLIIVAARPAMGKSAIVANIAENVAVKHNQPVAFFSLEMSEVELAQRFIACRARISGDKLRKGQVSQKDWPKVVRACNELEQAPLWFDDSSDLGVLDLRAKARRLHAQEQDKGGLGLIIVDYLQLMRTDDPRANRVEQVGQISRGLKILARELEVPVLAISQLSRAPEQRHPPKPMLSDLRESGNLEQDADVVAFLFREDYYRDPEDEPDGLADLIIAKHRNGPIASPKLVFLDRFPKFADYAGQDAADRTAGRRGPADRRRRRRRAGVLDGDRPQRTVPRSRLPARRLRRLRLDPRPRGRGARMRVPRPAAQTRSRPRRRLGDPAALPRRLLRPPAGLRHGARPADQGRGRPRCAASSTSSRPASRRGGGCGSSATPAPARRRWRCWSRRWPWRPATRWRSTRCRSCSPASAAPTTPSPAATPTSPSSSG